VVFRVRCGRRGVRAVGPCATSNAFEHWIENLEALDGPNAPALPAVLDKYADFNRRIRLVGYARTLAARAREIRVSQRKPRSRSD
jgi:hypothetical protein